MSRLPLRWKVTLAFSSALLVVLLAVGAFLYLRFAAELDASLDRGLRARSTEVAALVARAPAGLPAPGTGDLEADESFAQVLGRDGRVLASTAPAGAVLLTPAQVERARSAPIVVDRPGDARLDEATRLLARPAAGAAGRIVVVGTSLDDRDERLATLLALELTGLLVALVLASAAGYVVSGIALRPVEAMRRSAEAIADEPDGRLPGPSVDDEIGRLGRTLNAMLDRLAGARAAEREALERERRFIADAAHELRTPLTTLKAELEVAQLEGGGEAELRAALASAGEEADRLHRLTDDLLLLARADEGALVAKRHPVDLGDLLRRAAERRRETQAAAGRALIVRAAPGLVVQADPLLLEQAIANLADNALRHGGGDVELSAESDGAGGASIAVRDHGPGLPPAFAGQAFERFSRPDTGRSGGGTGLGLAIVAAIARAHGGDASIEDDAPGARVVLRLPPPA